MASYALGPTSEITSPFRRRNPGSSQFPSVTVTPPATSAHPDEAQDDDQPSERPWRPRYSIRSPIRSSESDPDTKGWGWEGASPDIGPRPPHQDGQKLKRIGNKRESVEVAVHWRGKRSSTLTGGLGLDTDEGRTMCPPRPLPKAFKTEAERKAEASNRFPSSVTSMRQSSPSPTTSPVALKRAFTDLGPRYLTFRYRFGQVRRIDTVGQTYYLQGELRFQWIDPLAVGAELVPPDIFVPMIEVKNAEQLLIYNKVVEVVDPAVGLLQKTQRFHATIYHCFQLKQFPFDVQHFCFEFVLLDDTNIAKIKEERDKKFWQSASRNDSLEKLLGDSGNASFFRKRAGRRSSELLRDRLSKCRGRLQHIDQSEWTPLSQINDVCIPIEEVWSACGDDGLSRSHVRIWFPMARRWSFYFWKVYFILFTLTSACFAANFIPYEEGVGVRLQTLVTLEVAMTAFMQSVANLLPRSSVFTKVDMYSVFCFLVILVVVLSNVMTTDEDILANFTIVVASAWGGFHVIYLLNVFWIGCSHRLLRATQERLKSISAAIYLTYATQMGSPTPPTPSSPSNLKTQQEGPHQPPRQTQTVLGRLIKGSHPPAPSTPQNTNTPSRIQTAPSWWRFGRSSLQARPTTVQTTSSPPSAPPLSESQLFQPVGPSDRDTLSPAPTAAPPMPSEGDREGQEYLASPKSPDVSPAHGRCAGRGSVSHSFRAGAATLSYPKSPLRGSGASVAMTSGVEHDDSRMQQQVLEESDSSVKRYSSMRFKDRDDTNLRFNVM
ncbi:unnamed protein product [Vitrella brassicaformis CCMP3155]|uniref:Neurotransmitter-gated ion-channel ligand-binding domain-containing protein n=1 Tax=Vitrella brassicaformis (strain CCMP3155) TaxID=1169540 RepID=A0A0G4F1T3_VITBC|nr:unnamed protein product [Vitrella brassicaformis CCMP3155]|eukprot:CEM05470.1 unnamed protein product [Vitrella brassicaformis CCMP3155]